MEFPMFSKIDVIGENRHELYTLLRGTYNYQNVKECKIRHGARKRDHFARAVFVSIVGGGGSTADTERIANQQSTL